MIIDNSEGTRWLLGLHLLVFAAMLVSGVDATAPDNQSLIRWGANFKARTLSGEEWRLLSSVWIHDGLVPLLVNLVALLFVGAAVEPVLGRGFFLLVYGLSGVFGSVMNLWGNDLAPSAGASGAVFGLYGVFVVLLLSGRFLSKTSPLALLLTTGLFVVYHLARDVQDGVDNTTHVGGLLSGLLLGAMWLPSLHAPDFPAVHRANLGLVLGVYALGTYLTYRQVPDAIVRYEGVMKQVAVNEKAALEVYRNAEGLSTYQWRKQLVKNGIRRWNENLTLLEGLAGLPQPLRGRVDRLRHYCSLRRSVFRMRANAIIQKTGRYEDQIRNTNLEIEGLLLELRTEKGREA
ncbi:MAG: rhomboid family intramembrane serine protease [Ferruginibacter sp.]|nr:rhomboid family intramembrane serine protease [Cytophagales bacterium]